MLSLSSEKKETLIVIAGEDSGDLYGGMLVRDILQCRPGLRVIGMGGDRMETAGVELLCHTRETAVMGVMEMLDKILFLWRMYRTILSLFDTGNLTGIVLIDYPDFNLPLARAAKKRNIPVFYYISPQVWAWRKGRIHTIKESVQRMMVILPFEKKFYEEEGVAADFVGHPLIDIVKPGRPQEELRKGFHIAGDGPVIGILPGSRKKEIRNLLPDILGAVRILRKKYRNASFLLPLSPSIEREYVMRFFREEDHHIAIVSGRNHDVMAASDVLITKSGTSTLEAAIAGVPMVIIYRASFFSVLLARVLVKVKFAGLPNLLADRIIVPELLQEYLNVDAVVKEVVLILENEDVRNRIREELGKVRDTLGSPGASLRAAKLVVGGLRY